MSGAESSLEPGGTYSLRVVPSASDQQRPSIISLGEHSHGLPGLLSSEAEVKQCIDKILQQLKQAQDSVP